MRLVLAAAAVLLTACGRTPSPEIAFVGTPHPTAVEVRGLPSRDFRALSSATLTQEQWSHVLRVEVQGASQAIAGRYAVADGRIRFTPMYGFDQGRTYVAAFNAALIPGAASEPWRQTVRQSVRPGSLSQTGGPIARSTVVRRVYPSGALIPENTLRFYLEFSAPMGRGGALEHIHLEEEGGRRVIDPFLPVEAEFWNADRTRFTLFFDPGRVKRGIKPNRDMGRALEAGKRYALVIGAPWRDGEGQMLRESHRHTFTAGPAEERALDTAAWKIAPARAGTREPLIVTFPWPLDYGLLQRALTVRSRATASHVVGEIALAGDETQWLFTPREPWSAGDYALSVMTLLEDPAGNRIGRAFEVTTPVNESERVEVGFSVKEP